MADKKKRPADALPDPNSFAGKLLKRRLALENGDAYGGNAFREPLKIKPKKK